MLRRNWKNQWLSLAVVVAVVLASAFMLIARVPEEVFARSADGTVTVMGASRSFTSLTIERVDNKEGTVYELFVVGNARVEDAEIVYLVSDLGRDVSELTLEIYDRSTMNWTPLPTVFDLANQTLSTHRDLSGSTLIRIGLRK